jgi:hypothetical protein
MVQRPPQNYEIRKHSKKESFFLSHHYYVELGHSSMTVRSVSQLKCKPGTEKCVPNKLGTRQVHLTNLVVNLTFSEFTEINLNDIQVKNNKPIKLKSEVVCRMSYCELRDAYLVRNYVKVYYKHKLL